MVLYRMCLEEPSHKDCETVRSKLWLIGRAYAASPQRGSGQPKNSDQKDFFLWLAKPLVKDNWMDKHLEKLIIKLQIPPQFRLPAAPSPQMRPHEISTAFADHDAGRVGVAADEARHDAGIGDI